MLKTRSETIWGKEKDKEEEGGVRWGMEWLRDGQVHVTLNENVFMKPITT